jgi:hypothetical protein
MVTLDSITLEILRPRFWAKVSKTPECWLWIGSTNENGYGRLSLPGHRTKRLSVGVHRLSYVLHFGPISDSDCVLHHCDNPPCIRPDHLFIGTQQDNVADRTQKGRGWSYFKAYPERRPRGAKHHTHKRPEAVARGERQGSAKLTDQQVLEIRARYATGAVSLRALARQYGLGSSQIYRIIQRKSWAHL